MPDNPLEGATVKSALRVLLITELLTEYDQGLSFPEIQAHLDVPKSSLFSILRTMATRGYLLFSEETRRYRLGVRYWEAGQAFLRGADLPGVADPHLQEASDALGETVQLAVLDGMENVYIAKVEANQRLQLVSRVGSRLPAYATGLGKVLLAYLDDDDLRARLAEIELEAHTPRTLADVGQLVEELGRIREQGYGTDDGEYTPGVFCVAVPVRDHEDRVVAAMSCSVPEVRLTHGYRERMIETLTEQAQAISAAMGRHSPSAASA